MTEIAEIRTQLLFKAVFTLGATIELGPGPLGIRRMVPILSGVFEGPKIKGELVPGGIDWQLARADNVTEVEAHYTLKTDDDVLIRVINKGYRHAPANVMQRLALGEPVSPAEYYFRAAPVLTAPAGRYGWLNQTLLISSGERYPDSVVIRVFEIL
jgi:Protein of unknown function (DUF3237)